MKIKSEKVVAAVLLVGGYGYLFALGLWRALGRVSRTGASGVLHEAKQPELATSHIPEPSPAPPVTHEEEQLESLSLSTPGDAPLDRLARRAAREKWEVRLIRNAPGDRASQALAAELSPHRPQHKEESVAEVLQHQELESDPLPGWSEPRPAKLPVPTYSPAIMALGIVIFALGLATVWYVCTVGAIVFAVAVWRWVGELQGE